VLGDQEPEAYDFPESDGCDLKDAIDVVDHDLPALTERAIKALEKANDPPHLFRQAGQVVRVEIDEGGRPIAVRAKVEILRREMAAAVPWVRTNWHIGARVSVAPPRDVVENVLATPGLPFPGLRGIVSAPFFTASGELAVDSGYIAGANLYLMLDVGLHVPKVPNEPTRAQVTEAIATLDDILEDFPFAGEADRCHALGMMILPAAREMIGGPTPLHVIDAPAPGTGKTLLAQVALHPACGTVSLMPFGRDEEETRKRLTSILLAGRAAAIFDNVRGRLDSANLSMVLTAAEWEDRILGASSQVRLPNRTEWIVTANNVTLSNELARRSISIRLDAQMERPFERQVFRHENILSYASQNRGALIAAVLTIVQAWLAAGRPKPKRSLGSYEAWSHVIGGALTHAGVDGFLENVDRLLRDADAEIEPWRTFVALWADEREERNATAAELLPLAERAEINVGTEPDEKTTRLGKLLAAHRDRIFVGHRIEKRTRIQGSQKWGLTAVELPSGGSGGSGGHSSRHLCDPGAGKIECAGTTAATHTTPTRNGFVPSVSSFAGGNLLESGTPAAAHAAGDDADVVAGTLDPEVAS